MMRKRKSWNGSIVVMGLLLSLCLTGCQGGQEPEEAVIMVESEAAMAEYSMVVASIGDVRKTQKLKCTYQQNGGQEVCFSLSGKEIVAVYVEKGDKVSKGQLLAELSSGRLDEQVETLNYRITRNKLLLEYAEINENSEISTQWLQYIYRTGQSDSDKEGLDERIENIQRSYRYTKEDCQDAIDLDSKELEALESEMAQGKVYAQMDGVVMECKSNLVGATSSREEVIMTIMDSSQCLFEVEGAEYIPFFKQGETIAMEITSGSGAGSYLLMPRKMEEWGDKLFFGVEEGDTSVIEVGMTGTIYLNLEERLQVLQIPAASTHTADDKPYVYVEGENGLREVRWVETGLYGDGNVEILSGLAEGEKVIN